jgi:hypothetical protein
MDIDVGQLPNIPPDQTGAFTFAALGDEDAVVMTTKGARGPFGTS